ncbi:MAG TPA: hypothetical protein DCP28_06760, partial [Cytophagales bacterium]|nr:hypothetical protein [Cytophagales bacterium]
MASVSEAQTITRINAADNREPTAATMDQDGNIYTWQRVNTGANSDYSMFMYDANDSYSRSQITSLFYESNTGQSINSMAILSTGEIIYVDQINSGQLYIQNNRGETPSPFLGSGNLSVAIDLEDNIYLVQQVSNQYIIRVYYASTSYASNNIIFPLGALTMETSSGPPIGLAVDRSGDVYFCTSILDPNITDGAVVKLDASEGYAEEILIDGTTAVDVAVDAFYNIYITCDITFNGFFEVLKLADGGYGADEILLEDVLTYDGGAGSEFRQFPVGIGASLYRGDVVIPNQNRTPSPTGELWLYDDIDPAPDAPTLTLQAVPSSVGEDDVSVAIRVFADPEPVNPVDFTLAIDPINSTAENTEDFVLATGGTINVGQSSFDVMLDIFGDTDYEGDEDIIVYIESSPGAIIAPEDAVMTIVDDDPQPTISIADNSVDEDGEGTGAGTLTVSLSGSSFETITVDYTVNTTAGTATAGADYTAVAGTLTFDPGETSQVINIPLFDDALYEGNPNPPIEDTETIVVDLSNSTNAVIGTSRGTLDIEDNDAANKPVLTDLEWDLTSVDEGESDVNISATIDRVSGVDVEIFFDFSAGSAGLNTDFSFTSDDHINIPAGQTVGSISVDISDDNLLEGAEEIEAGIDEVTEGINGGITSTTLEVLDTDTVFFTISDVTSLEGDSGTNPTFSFLANKTGADIVGTVSLDYTTTDNTAVAPSDYTTTSGTVNFTGTQNLQSIDVNVIGDDNAEGDEDFTLQFVNFGHDRGGTVIISDGTGIGTIQGDDDAPRTISIADNSGDESTNGELTVSLSGPKFSDVEVDYVVNVGSSTAESGTDFTPVSGTLNFPALSTTQTITIPVADDGILEDDETIVVQLSNPNNATIVDAEGVYTINDNDAANAPVLSDFAWAVPGADEGTVDVGLVATIDRITGVDVVVEFDLLTGTAYATRNSDYTAPATESIVIPAGSLSGTYEVDFLDDNFLEGDELVRAAFNSISVGSDGGFSGSPIDVTIQDTDQTLFAIGDAIVTEGDAGQFPTTTFTVTLSGDDIQDSVVVDFETVDGTAVVGTDLVAEVGELVFYTGDINKTIEVTIIGDDDEEGDEVFAVELTNVDHWNSGDVGITSSTGQGTILGDDQAPAVPTVSIPSVTNSLTNQGTLSVSLTFNEPISGLALSDLSLSHGSVSNLSPATGVGDTFTFDWDISGTGDGTKTVGLPANRVVDGIGGNNVASNVVAIRYDATAPMLSFSSITVGDGEPTNSDSVIVRANFGEDVSGFDAADINSTNGTITSGPTRISQGNYVFAVKAMAEGQVTVSISAGALTDSAGNSLAAAASFGYRYDVTPPVATITPSVPSPGNSNNFPVTVNWSEGVEGFVNGELQESSAGFFGTLLTVSEKEFSANMAVFADETFNIFIAAGAAMDSAGNTNAAVSIPYEYDNTPPSVSVNSLLTNSATPTVTG